MKQRAGRSGLTERLGRDRDASVSLIRALENETIDLETAAQCAAMAIRIDDRDLLEMVLALLRDVPGNCGEIREQVREAIAARG